MELIGNLGFGELMFILIMAGVVMGPERIRNVARWLGRINAQLQSFSRAFMKQLNDELDANERGELKAALADIKSLQDEMRQLRTEIASAPQALMGDAQAAVDEAKQALSPAANGAVTRNGAQTAVAAAAAAVDDEPENSMMPPNLPTAIEVEDDPE